MAKVIKEIIIMLVICLLTMLVLAIALYRYIPNRKAVPEVVTYTASEDVQDLLEDNIDTKSDQDNVILTYEVTASDLSVRTGPGTGYRRKRHDELTADGKKHDKDKDGCLDKGTRVTVYEWKNGWARTPSGWLSGDYLRKV